MTSPAFGVVPGRQGRQPAAAQPAIHVEWSGRDTHRHLTWLAAIGLGAAGLLAVFGLPPLDLHGPLHRFGIMDPACGLTRGVRLVALGRLRRAVAYNPASPLVVLGAAGVGLRAVGGRLTGHWLNVGLRLGWQGRGLVALGIAALWVNQQLHAALLMR